MKGLGWGEIKGQIDVTMKRLEMGSSWGMC